MGCFGVASVSRVGHAACLGIKDTHSGHSVNGISRDAQIYLSQRVFEAIAVACCPFQLCVGDTTCTISVQKNKALREK